MEDYYGIKSRRAREYIRSLPFKKKIPFRALFPKSNDLALDLLEKLLAFNPAKRISVEDALRHPYLEPYHDPEDEPTAPPIPEGFFDFDKNKDSLSKEQLKRELNLGLMPLSLPVREVESENYNVLMICFFSSSVDIRGDYAVGRTARETIAMFFFSSLSFWSMHSFDQLSAWTRLCRG
jgi:serine/threonine protein kinase